MWGLLKGLFFPLRALGASSHPVCSGPCLVPGQGQCSGSPSPWVGLPPCFGSSFHEAASSVEQRVRELVNKHTGESVICSEKPLGVHSHGGVTE